MPDGESDLPHAVRAAVAVVVAVCYQPCLSHDFYFALSLHAIFEERRSVVFIVSINCV